MVDLHVHTNFSFDSDEQPENYIKRAGELNAKMLGFSEHYDYDAFLDGAEGVELADIPAYLEKIKSLNKSCGDTQILCGIEFGYRKAAQEQYRTLIEKYPFDYVINSVHTLPGRGDSYYEGFFDGATIEDSYRDYFKVVLESVYADFDYQIIGHIGYVSRYRDVLHKIIYDDYSDIIDDILKAVIERDKCLEINTASGHADVLCLPDTDIIKRYLALGGRKMSFGSDAHSAEKFMSKSDRVKDFLKSVGVGELYYYRERKPVAYKI